MDVAKNFESTNERINALIAKNNGEFKATIISMNDWGFTTTSFVKVQKCELKGYAQYHNGLYMEIKKKGGRSLYGCRLYEAVDFAVFDGWVEPEKQMPRSFTGFDKSLFYEIVDSVKADKLGEQSERLYAAERAEKPKKYIVVSMDGTHEFDTVERLAEAHEITGLLKDNVCRVELQGQPYLKGLCGPMYDGDENGYAVIRYETQEVYNMLSN